VGDAERFQRERPRLVRLAAGVLQDHAEAEDVVQQAWLRLERTDAQVENLPGWLTTVTTRLCLDRLRARTPVPVDKVPSPEVEADVAEDLVLADTVGVALQVLLERLTPRERVAFVLKDTFGFDFSTIAAILDVTPEAARKLASRARGRIRQTPAPDVGLDRPADWQVVDAFMAAARGGELDRLIALLAPDAVVSADAAAMQAGTPQHIQGREAVATFFNGSAQATLAVFVGQRPAAAWFHRGEARVVFDFTVTGGRVSAITFLADPAVLAQVTRRRGEHQHP
jgi:RNA polymerase sigma factor (sigma-70 family)